MLQVLVKICLKALKNTLLFKKKYVIIFLIIILISFIRCNHISSRYSSSDDTFVLKVISKKFKNDLYYVEFSGKEKLIGYYQDFAYDIGDVVVIKGNLKEIQEKTIPNIFNYKKYLQSREIYYTLYIRKISLKKKNNSFFNNIKKEIIKRIELQKNKDYLYAFILGDISFFEDEKKEVFIDNGIFFLMSIGYFQIYLIKLFFRWLKRKWRLNFIIYYLIILIVIIFYIYLTNVKISILKNGLLLLISELLKYKHTRYKKNILLIFIGGIILLIKPIYIYNISFWYSFIISIGLSLLKGRKSFFIISFYSFLLSSPLLIYSNYELNFASFFWGILLFLPINYLLFPLCIASLCFPFLSGLLNFTIIILEKINYIFNKIYLFKIIFPKPSIIIVMLYFLIIYYVLKNKKNILFLVLLLFIHSNSNYFINEKNISFLDVGQGDAILIKNHSNGYLIDTGGSQYKNYSRDIIQYIKSLGLKKITLIVTQGH